MWEFYGAKYLLELSDSNCFVQETNKYLIKTKEKKKKKNQKIYIYIYRERERERERC